MTTKTHENIVPIMMWVLAVLIAFFFAGHGKIKRETRVGLDAQPVAASTYELVRR